MTTHQIKINRAPVLTLWTSIVAERLGYDEPEALSLARGLAGLNAQSKGERLGIYKPSEKGKAETKRKERAEESVQILGRAVPVVETKEGLRATSNHRPINPSAVQRYLQSKFGAALPEVRKAMQDLADALTPAELSSRAYDLYEEFRPQIPGGKRGWGAQGELDLDYVRSMAERFHRREHRPSHPSEHRDSSAQSSARPPAP